MITSLTKEQEAKFVEYVKKGVEIGLSTSPLIQEDVEKVIRELYSCILKTQLEKVVIVDSPIAAWKYIQEASKLQGPNNIIWPFLSGSFDSNIFQFYDYFINELDVKIDDALMVQYKVWKKTQDFGIIYPFDDICIVSRKPTKIHWDMTRSLLHNETGPAIEYADGFAVYLLNGVRMKKEYVETPWNELDPILVLRETNAEVRRELVRKIGIERLVEKLGCTILDAEGDYELLNVDLKDGRIRPYLKMKNPSIQVYHIEGVHPDCRTVKDALKYRNGTTDSPVKLS
jgi:hypothetical protein